MARGMLRWCIGLLSLSCGGALWAEEPAADPAPKFSLEAWQRAADPNAPDWSRDALLKQFTTQTQIDGMAREQLLRGLGEPGVAHEIYYPGGGFQGRIDLYRLSAKNEESFRIDYDKADKVSGHSIDASPCGCTMCQSDPSEGGSGVQSAALHASVLRPAADGPFTPPSFSALETLVGQAGKRSTTESRAGGQTWGAYSELWRVANEPHRFFIASGNLARTQEKSFDEVPVSDYRLIMDWPECLPPPS